MKSTRLSIVMIMTLLFLLPTGCRKDDAATQLDQADAQLMGDFLSDAQLMRDFLSDDYFATAAIYYTLLR
jgi:hypothetical protein